jgi:hypothetical protein
MQDVIVEKPDMVAQVNNPSTQEAEGEHCKFHASLGCITRSETDLRSCLRKAKPNKQTNKKPNYIGNFVVTAQSL